MKNRRSAEYIAYVAALGLGACTDHQFAGAGALDLSPIEVAGTAQRIDRLMQSQALPPAGPDGARPLTIAPPSPVFERGPNGISRIRNQNMAPQRGIDYAAWQRQCESSPDFRWDASRRHCFPTEATLARRKAAAQAAAAARATPVDDRARDQAHIDYMREMIHRSRRTPEM